jgi:hypothetical protein
VYVWRMVQEARKMVWKKVRMEVQRRMQPTAEA